MPSMPSHSRTLDAQILAGGAVGDNWRKKDATRTTSSILGVCTCLGLSTQLYPRPVPPADTAPRVLGGQRADADAGWENGCTVQGLSRRGHLAQLEGSNEASERHSHVALCAQPRHVASLQGIPFQEAFQRIRFHHLEAVKQRHRMHERCASQIK